MLNPYEDKHLVQMVKDQLDLISTIGITYVDQKGEFIRFDSFRVTSDKFTNVHKKVMTREIENAEDIKFDFEEPLRKYIKNVDFHKGTVLLSRCKAGLRFPPHYHAEIERLTTVIGNAYVNLYEEVDEVLTLIKTIQLPPGKSYLLEAMQVHDYITTKDTQCLIELRPKLPGLVRK